MSAPETAPVLSTPDTHIFEDPSPAVDVSSLPRLSDEQVAITYEIERTVREIREGRWKRIALQFPDHMLVDAPRVYEGLGKGLEHARKNAPAAEETGPAVEKKILESNGLEEDIAAKLNGVQLENAEAGDAEENLFILGDTSYGACCVDEVAAEHVDADVVVHYGRSCLSPPSRLPVIYVFTARPLDLDTVLTTFKDTYPSKDQKIVLMADIPYSHHITPLHARLQQEGYTQTFATEIIHDPSSPLPNRTTPPETNDAPDALREYQLFHISDPPESLLLTLSSRVGAVHVYPTTTTTSSSSTPTNPPTALLASTTLTLRRRYALLTRLSSVPVFGILINTLSVRNYMTILSHVQRLITAAGKKHYTFVVGKVNAAKVANFSEVGGWVVIGCWESSLIESREFWRPMITTFEVGVALMGDEERVWRGEWRGDFESILQDEEKSKNEKEKAVADGMHVDESAHASANAEPDVGAEGEGDVHGDYDSEEESAPPEFDLRTGRYVSHSRPMRAAAPKKSNFNPSLQQDVQHHNSGSTNTAASSALTKRAIGDLAQIGGVVSPGAEYLRSQRTWQGLGTDYAEQEESESVGANAAVMEEGRSGIARGYTVDKGVKH